MHTFYFVALNNESLDFSADGKFFAMVNLLLVHEEGERRLLGQLEYVAYIFDLETGSAQRKSKVKESSGDMKGGKLSPKTSTATE